MVSGRLMAVRKVYETVVISGYRVLAVSGNWCKIFIGLICQPRGRGSR
jgi:hypothetical protein